MAGAQITTMCKCGTRQTFAVPPDLDAHPVLEATCPDCGAVASIPIALLMREVTKANEERKRAQAMKPMLPALLPKAIAWAEAQGALGLASGRPLDENEIELARKVGVEHPECIRVKIVDEIPAPDDPVLKDAALQTGLAGPGIAGLTIGYAVFVRAGCESAPLLAHELRHVYQVEQADSLAAYLTQYLQQIVEHGYIGAPFEADAGAHARMALNKP